MGNTGNSQLFGRSKPRIWPKESQKFAVPRVDFPTRGTGKFEIGNSEVVFGEQRMSRARAGKEARRSADDGLDVTVLVEVSLEEDERVSVALTKHLLGETEHALCVSLREPNRWLDLLNR